MVTKIMNWIDGKFKRFKIRKERRYNLVVVNGEIKRP